MDAFPIVDIFDETPNLRTGIRKVIILGQIHLLFFDGPHQSLGKTIFFGFPRGGHADLDVVLFEQIDIFQGGILNALIAVMDFRQTQAERHPQCCQGQAGIQDLFKAPAADRTGEDIHDRCQINEPVAEPDIRDINGLITNDKFCMIRSARLQLRANPSYPLCYYPAYQPLSRYPSDEISHHGGDDETSMAHSPTVQGISGRTATLGSRVPISSAMGNQCANDTKHSNSNPEEISGGES